MMPQNNSEVGAEIVIVWHGPYCPDGFTASWVLNKAYPGAILIPGVYQSKTPDELADKHVIFVDFCYKRKQMEEIAAIVKSMTVLDHHKTAMEDMEGFSAPNAQIHFDMDQSGARIAWEFVVANNLLSEEVKQSMLAYRPSFTEGIRTDVPWLVQYIEDRDLWRYKLPHSDPVSLAIRSYPLTFESWDDTNSGKRSHVLEDGEAILRSNNDTVQSQIANAIEIELGGVKGLAVNATTLFSETAGELAKKAPFGATWRVSKYAIEWSLRSKNDGGADVGKIATQYEFTNDQGKTSGGGGHEHAAGFRSTSKLLLDLKLL